VLQEVLPAGEARASVSQKTRIRPEKRRGTLEAADTWSQLLCARALQDKRLHGTLDTKLHGACVHGACVHGACVPECGTLDTGPRPCRKSTAAGTKFTCFTGTEVQLLTSCQTSAAGPQEEEAGRQSARCWEHMKEKEESACLRRACGSCKRRRTESQSNVIEP
jgi:hypothetical protein